MSTIIFDTETTGLLKPDTVDVAEQPYIIEIFCLKIDKDLEIVDSYESFIAPPIKLPEKITQITGITDDMLKGQKNFSELYNELSEFFLGVDTMVAHNLAFDRGMIVNELFRINRVLQFPWPMKHICTVEKTMHLEQRRMNLTRLHEHLFNKGFPNAHRAKNDVMPLYDCYKELVKTGVIK